MLIYFVVSFIATIIGASAGMGGGVIIKPVLDLLGDYNIVTISILSSITVLSMAIVSTIKQMKKGFKVTIAMVYTTVGAVAGGIIGSIVFSLFKNGMDYNMVTAVQSFILFGLLAVCLLFKKIPTFNIQSLWIKALIGIMLGLFSSFLAIGGGPINVAVLCVFFNIELRNAARISVFIILFSQIAGLIAKGANGLFYAVEDYSMLLVMIPAAIIGGLIGAHFNISISDKKIKSIFIASVACVMCISMYNAISAILA